MRAAALGAALLALAGAGGAGALELAQKGSHVLELFADDFDENKVPIYDGPGEFIAVAFYAPWCQQVFAAPAPLPPSALSLPPPPPSLLPAAPPPPDGFSTETPACRWSDPLPLPLPGYRPGPLARQTHKFMPEYEKIAEIMREEGDTKFILARVNAELPENQALSGHYKIRGPAASAPGAAFPLGPIARRTSRCFWRFYPCRPGASSCRTCSRASSS